MSQQNPSPSTRPGSSRSALIVRGGWEGHQPIETTDLFVPFLREHGFTVRIEDSPAVYADEAALDEVDLIVQSVTMSTIADDQVRGLRRAVERGTGLAGWHGGIADSYRDSSDYLQLIGGSFAAHPLKPEAEQRGDGEDAFRRHTIHLVGDHPIVAGLDDFELTTEQYWVLHDDYIDVHATTTQAARPGDAWNREIVSPAVWTRQWGAGRVFVATPGHTPEILSHPSVRTLVERGLLWASR